MIFSYLFFGYGYTFKVQYIFRMILYRVNSQAKEFQSFFHISIHVGSTWISISEISDMNFYTWMRSCEFLKPFTIVVDERKTSIASVYCEKNVPTLQEFHKHLAKCEFLNPRFHIMV